MTSAHNPQTGEVLTLGADGQWTKPQMAQNPETGVTLFLDGDAWKPVPSRSRATQLAPDTPEALKTLRDSATGLAKGATFGFSDELQAGLATPIELAIGAFKGTDDGKGLGDRIGDAYGRGLERFRRIEKEASERSPVASTIGEISGGLGTGGALQKGGATLLNTAKPTVASMAGRGAAEGAAYGGVQGFGTGEGIDDRINRAVAGGGLGALTGGVMGAVGARGAQKAADATVPSTDVLKRAAHNAYDAAENAGVVVSQPSFNAAVDDILNTAKMAGIDRTIHPKVTAALGRMDEARGTTPSLKDLDLLRRVAKSAGASMDADERRIAGIVVDKLDDYIHGLQPQDVLSGNVKVATDALSDARNFWSRTRKAELLEDMMEKAANNAPNFSGSGMENAIRSQFRQLVNNPKRLRGFSEEEVEAIQKVARGGPVENALRMLGKFAPTGVVSSALSGGTGFAAGGPIGAMALPAVGLGARHLATVMTNRNAKLAELLVRSGGQRPSAQQISGPQRALIEALLIGTGQQGSEAGDAVPLATALRSMSR